MTKYLSNCSQIPAQIVPKSSQNRPKMGLGRLLGPSRASPERPRSAQEPQDAPKTAPRAPQERIRGPQERPKRAQESPKSAQEAPKRGPRPSKREPRRLQEGSEVRPKRHSGEILKKPQFLQLDPMALRYTGGPRKSQKIDKNRPRKAKKIDKNRQIEGKRAKMRPKKAKRAPK